jgi:sterol desaturase/sphingolipid hydroxylase (fatty acid hydroxylase superfamily)
MSSMKTLPIWISVSFAAAGFLLLTSLETRRPLRRAVDSKRRRSAINLIHGGLDAAALALAEAPLVWPIAAAVEGHGWGLLPLFRMPRWLEIPAALILMDYTFYVWHVLLHRVPFLWRFHLVHHTDLDLDASTALRFHFGELLVSVPWRAAQVMLIGIGPSTFSLWQLFFGISVLFHHSNLQLPLIWERRLNRFIVTPRMHGIHHSIVEAETNSNWSSGLTVWDRLHGTLRLNVRQAEIAIGVPAFRTPETLALGKTIFMPFESQLETWQFPGGGRPTPHRVTTTPHHLLE